MHGDSKESQVWGVERGNRRPNQVPINLVGSASGGRRPAEPLSRARRPASSMMSSSRAARREAAYHSPGADGQCQGLCCGGGPSWQPSAVSQPTCTPCESVTDAASVLTPAPIHQLPAPSTASRSSWRSRAARREAGYRSPAAEQTPAAPPPDSWSRAARCAIAYLSPPAAAPSVTPPLQADDQAASSPLRFSPSARVFSSPADPLCRTLELGQLAEMQKSPALSVEQLCSLIPAVACVRSDSQARTNAVGRIGELDGIQPDV